jgi:hypothetical protein
MLSHQHKLDTILDIVKSNDFDHDDVLYLIKGFTDIYQYKSNNIIQKIPRETWAHIIDLFDRKKQIQICIYFRLVCKMWNNIIQNFTKITTLYPYKLPLNHREFFPKLKTLIIDFMYGNYASSFINLTKLEIVGSRDYSAWNLTMLTNLTTLSIVRSYNIVDDDLRLTQLTELKLYCTTLLIGTCFKFLTNLKHLKLVLNDSIKNEYISYLINLKYLKIPSNDIIENEHISHLTNLTIIRKKLIYKV